MRNVPDEVAGALERLASREGLSVNGLVVRELRLVAARADNPALLAALPNLDVVPEDVIADLEAGRSVR